MPGSALRLATTAYDDPAQSNNAVKKPSCQPSHYFSRWPDVNRTIHSVARFRLCSTELALAAGIDLPEIPRLLKHPTWTWRPRFARNSDTKKIAWDLISESEDYFRLVCFEDWVQEVTGSSSSTVRSLESKYEGLSGSLYFYLVRHPEEYGKYVGSINILKENSDPFLLQAVQHACNCVENQKYAKCSFNSRFITDPLGKTLTRSPTSLLFYQLEALAVRFQRWYIYKSPDVIWSQDFDTQTEFLNNLYHIEPETLAVQLSETDLSLFQRLAAEDISKGSGDVLSVLNNRWNSLCFSVEECSFAGDSFDLCLVKLAQKLSRLRNFYSLTAILQGIRSSKRSIAALQRFDYLIHSEAKYWSYRQNIDPDPALHFLVPFLGTRSENTTAVDSARVVSAAQRYTLQDEIINKPSHHTGLLSIWRSLCL